MPLPFIALATGAIFTLGYIFNKGKPKKVFISFYSKADSHYKNLISAWVKNKKFNFHIEDYSTNVGIKSSDKNYLKRRMKQQIEKADYFIVFIGEKTYSRDWILWEIEQAKGFNKKIIAVKENKSHKSPKPLLNCNATWVYEFSVQGLKKALEA